MKRFFLFVLLNICFLAVRASDTVFVHETQIPILIERNDNVLFQLRFMADGQDRMLDEVKLHFGNDVDLASIQSVKLYYAGTEARQNYGKPSFAPVSYVSAFVPGKTLAANPSYSIHKSQVDTPDRKVVLRAGQKLFPGINYFWISLQMKPDASLFTKVTAGIDAVGVDGKEARRYYPLDGDRRAPCRR